jgi:hypothetical protein
MAKEPPLPSSRLRLLLCHAIEAAAIAFDYPSNTVLGKRCIQLHSFVRKTDEGRECSESEVDLTEQPRDCSSVLVVVLCTAMSFQVFMPLLVTRSF